jgi:hypothetical protein
MANNYAKMAGYAAPFDALQREIESQGYRLTRFNKFFWARYATG